MVDGKLNLDEVDGVTEATAVAPTIVIEIPVVPFDPAVYRSNFLQLRLSQRQADAARVLFDGLHNSGAKLASGHHVDTQSDAVKWLLERVADAVSPDVNA